MKAKNIFMAFFVILAFTIVAIMATDSVVLAQDTADGDGIIEPGEDTTEELAKAVQNPVASMISLPFQNNTHPAGLALLAERGVESHYADHCAGDLTAGVHPRRWSNRWAWRHKLHRFFLPCQAGQMDLGRRARAPFADRHR
jgi:hypothetical protein